jgi:hypothetical protein
MCRVPQVNRNGKEDNNNNDDPIKPVFVSEFPQLVCDEQAISSHKQIPCENYYCIYCFIFIFL